MKVTQGEAVKATVALQSLRQKSMNSQTAFALFRLKKALSEIVEFQAEQEVALAKELGGEANEYGQIVLKDDEARAEYSRRHRELVNVECEVDIGKQAIPLADVPQLTMDEIEALIPFVDFK